jgi:hypothetical protein
MTDIMQIRLLAMIDEEMKQVVGMISNETVWMHGSANEEESQMHVDNMADLEEYKNLLLRMREQVVEGELNV